jgi:hypothetical protein
LLAELNQLCVQFARPSGRPECGSEHDRTGCDGQANNHRLRHIHRPASISIVVSYGAHGFRIDEMRLLASETLHRLRGLAIDFLGNPPLDV